MHQPIEELSTQARLRRAGDLILMAEACRSDGRHKDAATAIHQAVLLLSRAHSDMTNLARMTQ